MLAMGDVDVLARPNGLRLADRCPTVAFRSAGPQTKMRLVSEYVNMANGKETDREIDCREKPRYGGGVYRSIAIDRSESRSTGVCRTSVHGEHMAPVAPPVGVVGADLVLRSHVCAVQRVHVTAVRLHPTVQQPPALPLAPAVLVGRFRGCRLVHVVGHGRGPFRATVHPTPHLDDSTNKSAKIGSMRHDDTNRRLKSSGSLTLTGYPAILVRSFI